LAAWGFVLFLRFNDLNKMSMRNTRTKTASLLTLVLLALVGLQHQLAHADSETLSNVVGDEIIVYTDESYKPAIRDLGTMPSVQPAPTVQTDSAAKKNLSNSAPSYNNTPGISPNYSSGEYVAPKPKRALRLDEPLESASTDNLQAYISEEVSRNDLWQRIKNGYVIPDSSSPLTKKHEDWYSSRPDYIKRMVERSQRYLFHVVEEVEKRGMPTEIALLPMIESAYNPKAYSTSRASGIWQFIPSTGKHFGLKQNWWFDNRRNITFATDAALTYLQKLHAMFGSWDLALAAYNAGEGTVGRAIERNRKLGLATDYESLNLPPETRNYVPKLQAIKNIMTNPNNFGLDVQTIANTPYFAKVTAPAQIDAHLAAKLAEISDEEFLALNPSFNRPLIKSEEKNLELLLPILSAQTFRTNLDNYNKPLVSWQTYFAKRGEHLEKIASKFGIHVSKLRDVNDLPSQKKIKTTTTLLVPNGNVTDFKPNGKATSTIEVANNSVTNASVFEREISNNNLAGAEESLLKNALSDENEPKTQASVTHKVAKGEGIYGIANRYGTTSKQIMLDNDLKSSRVNIGQLLTINNVTQKQQQTETKKTRTYIVKRGDTLHSIAEKFDVAVVDLKRWNNINHNRIQPGNKLTIIQSDSV
jgi:membrane-bound lytic murein transglycosylase D